MVALKRAVWFFLPLPADQTRLQARLVCRPDWSVGLGQKRKKKKFS